MVQANKQMDEQVAQYLHPDFWLFWTIVHEKRGEKKKMARRRKEMRRRRVDHGH